MLGMQTILNAKFRSGQSFDNAICNNYINISAICKKKEEDFHMGGVRTYIKNIHWLQMWQILLKQFENNYLLVTVT